jgi:hypothetical protein
MLGYTHIHMYAGMPMSLAWIFFIINIPWRLRLQVLEINVIQRQYLTYILVH